MKRLQKILILVLISAKVFATPQDSEILIYGKDTLYIDIYPLEVLMNENQELHKKIMNASDCMQTSCWRAHHGTWRIVNDSLFLVKLEDGCQEKELDISKFFDSSKISNNGVFAYWFSQRLVTNYGKYLDYNETTWSPIYEGFFKCNVNIGVISNVKIEMKESTEIETIIKKSIEKEDTTVCLIVDEYPILLADDKEYKNEELKEFISKHIRYPENGIDCTGRVYISFVVEKNGAITNKEYIRKLCDGFNEEAMRIIDMMKNWKPGLINGVPVRTKIAVPVIFLI
nr:energy transducer TonB [uncultured Draconibacterium sp.]